SRLGGHCRFAGPADPDRICRRPGYYSRCTQRLLPRRWPDDGHSAAVLVLVHTYHLSTEHPARERSRLAEMEPHGPSDPVLSGYLRAGRMAAMERTLANDLDIGAAVPVRTIAVPQTIW